RNLQRRQTTQGSSGTEGVTRGQIDSGQQERQHARRHLDLVRAPRVDDHPLVGALRALEQLASGQRDRVAARRAQDGERLAVGEGGQEATLLIRSVAQGLDGDALCVRRIAGRRSGWNQQLPLEQRGGTAAVGGLPASLAPLAGVLGLVRITIHARLGGPFLAHAATTVASLASAAS